MTYNDFIKLFPKEDDAIDWIILRKYKNGYKCPKCGLKKNVYRQNYNRRFLYCNNCKYEFSALKGTIFENTHLDLRMWLYVKMLLEVSSKRGSSRQYYLHKMFGMSQQLAKEAIRQIDIEKITAMSLKKELGISYQSAYRILDKVRYDMVQYFVMHCQKTNNNTIKTHKNEDFINPTSSQVKKG